MRKEMKTGLAALSIAGLVVLGNQTNVLADTPVDDGTDSGQNASEISETKAASAQNMEEAENNLDDALGSQTEAEEKVDQAETDLKEAQDERDTIKEEQSDLSTSVEEAKDSLESAIKDEKDSAQAAKDQAEADLKESEEKQETAEKEAAEAKDNVSKAEDNLKEKEEAVKKAEEEGTEASEEEIAEAKEKVEQAEEKVETAQEEYNKADAAAQEEEKKLETAQKEFDQADAEYMPIHEKTSQMEGQINRLIFESFDLDDEYNAILAAIEEMKQNESSYDPETYKETMEQLEKELAEKKKEIEINDNTRKELEDEFLILQEIFMEKGYVWTEKSEALDAAKDSYEKASQVRDEKKSVLDSAKEELESAQKALDALSNKDLQEALKAKEQAEADLQTAKDALETAQKNLEAAKAETESSRKVLEEAQVALEQANGLTLEKVLAADENDPFYQKHKETIDLINTAPDRLAELEKELKEAEANVGEKQEALETAQKKKAEADADVAIAAAEWQKYLKIVKGDGAEYTKGSGKELNLIANGDMFKFDTLLIDGVEAENYGVLMKSYETEVILEKSVLDKLSAGAHKVTFKYQYGEVSATIYIKEAEGTQDPKPGAGEGTETGGGTQTGGETGGNIQIGGGTGSGTQTGGIIEAGGSGTGNAGGLTETISAAGDNAAVQTAGSTTAGKIPKTGDNGIFGLIAQMTAALGAVFVLAGKKFHDSRK